MSALLSLSHVSVRFGGVQALQDVTLELDSGELVGLIGPNGAGKTTMMNVVSGVRRPNDGDVFFGGQRLADVRSHRVNHLGIARTFQIPKPFVGMTVEENVRTAAYFGGQRDGDRQERRHAVAHALDMTGLSAQRAVAAETLNVAGRKRLELARALAMSPKLLLLDEVMAGLNLKEVERVMQVVRDVHGTGMTVILIEHVMKAVMGLAERVVVLHHGKVLSEGSPAAVTADPQVIEAYLGKGATSQGGGAQGASAARATTPEGAMQLPDQDPA